MIYIFLSFFVLTLYYSSISTLRYFAREFKGIDRAIYPSAVNIKMKRRRDIFFGEN
jgi:hypothetical protein